MLFAAAFGRWPLRFWQLLPFVPEGGSICGALVVAETSKARRSSMSSIGRRVAV